MSTTSDQLDRACVDYDFTGLRCPLPLLKLKQAMRSIDPGCLIHVLTSDQGSLRDFQAFCESGGHECLDVVVHDGKGYSPTGEGPVYAFTIRSCR